jgi:transmembrane sensor
MADDRLEPRLELARRAAPVFGLARQQRVIWGVRRRLQGPGAGARRLLPLAAALAVVSVLLGGYVWSRRSPEPVATLGDERWQLRDGSRILIETPQTRITKQREAEGEVLFELEAGAARFDVTHRPGRAFRVQAGSVRVEVVGTQFRVQRSGESTQVSVERGRVRVSWPGGVREVSAGESGSFPPSEGTRVETAVAIPSAPPAVAEPKSTLPSAEQLFAAADRARAEGRPLEAVQSLRQLIQRFPRDGRAPLAAFTLGRLLLESLHQPAEAARAFAQARALAGPGSALAEDALAREADALRAAGSSSEAAKRAELYRTLYPHGARIKHLPAP